MCVCKCMHTYINIEKECNLFYITYTPWALGANFLLWFCNLDFPVAQKGFLVLFVILTEAKRFPSSGEPISHSCGPP